MRQSRFYIYHFSTVDERGNNPKDFKSFSLETPLAHLHEGGLMSMEEPKDKQQLFVVKRIEVVPVFDEEGEVQSQLTFVRMNRILA